MTTIGEVRSALADCLRSIGGLEVNAYQTNQIVAPAAQVSRGAMDPRMVFSGGTNAYAFTITVFVSLTAGIDAQQAMDRYCETSGAWSVKAAVELETNWPDGLVDYAQVTEIGALEVTPVVELEYLTTQFEIEVVW